jgi:hypothetical protein
VPAVKLSYIGAFSYPLVKVNLALNWKQKKKQNRTEQERGPRVRRPEHQSKIRQNYLLREAGYVRRRRLLENNKHIHEMFIAF